MLLFVKLRIGSKKKPIMRWAFSMVVSFDYVYFMRDCALNFLKLSKALK